MLKCIEDAKGNVINKSDLDLIFGNSLAAETAYEMYGAVLDDCRYDVISNVRRVKNFNLDDLTEDETVSGFFGNISGNEIEDVNVIVSPLFYFPDCVPEDDIDNKIELFKFIVWCLVNAEDDDCVTQDDLKDICRFWQEFTGSTMGEHFAYRLSGGL